MSVDRLKKQAKNARPLLAALTAGTTCTLSQAQTFVAQIHGYPDWHSAIKAQEKEQPPKHERTEVPYVWFLKYAESNKHDQRQIDEFRLIRDPNDAIATLFVFYDAFCERNDVAGFSDTFTLETIPCSELHARSRQQLRLTQHARNTILHLSLYPMNSDVLMLDPPYTKVFPMMKEHVDKFVETDNLQHMMDAAMVPFVVLKKQLVDYETAHPASAMKKDLDKMVQESLQKASTRTDASREKPGIWTCETLRIGRWRFQLIYFTENHTFYLDVFDEGHNQASFLHPAADAAIKRKPSGQWVACEFKGKSQIVLTGLHDNFMDQLREAAVLWGIGFVVDGMTEVTPLRKEPSQCQASFLQWLEKQ